MLRSKWKQGTQRNKATFHIFSWPASNVIAINQELATWIHHLLSRFGILTQTNSDKHREEAGYLFDSVFLFYPSCFFTTHNSLVGESLGDRTMEIIATNNIPFISLISYPKPEISGFNIPNVRWERPLIDITNSVFELLLNVINGPADVRISNCQFSPFEIAGSSLGCLGSIIPSTVFH